MSLGSTKHTTTKRSRHSVRNCQIIMMAILFFGHEIDYHKTLDDFSLPYGKKCPRLNGESWANKKLSKYCFEIRHQILRDSQYDTRNKYIFERFYSYKHRFMIN